MAELFFCADLHARKERRHLCSQTLLIVFSVSQDYFSRHLDCELHDHSIRFWGSDLTINYLSTNFSRLIFVQKV